MGYDFNLLDFIAFNDPKLSFKDIIQCIGRGIRSDCLGINGINLNKYLIILLPVYVGESADKENKYHNIKKVLQYLLHDIKLSIGDFWFVDFTNVTNVTNVTFV
jgi:predicted helicase